jgi:AcrR family transcriptional regulator
MSDAVKPKRAYDASRRQEQARANRLAVLDAARALFLEHGYAQTTMKMVAREARLSTQSVYQVFGNKPGLVKALIDVAVVGDDEPIPMMERQFVRGNMAEPDPAKKLRDYGAHLAEVAPRVNPVMVVLRDAAAADAAAAEVWEQTRRERLTGMTHFAAHMEAERFLRDGVSEAEARDVLWTFSSFELWDLLVRQRRWSTRRYGRWVGEQLVAALL